MDESAPARAFGADVRESARCPDCAWSGEWCGSHESPLYCARDAGPVIDIRTIRAWAIENKVEGVGAVGKLSKSVIEAYKTAHAADDEE